MSEQSVRETQSVLDQLVADVTKRGTEKAARLTPTTSEVKVASPLAGFGVAFPYDSPETMIQALNVALDELDHVRKGIVTILAALGGEAGPADTPDPVDEKKAAEKAADEAARERTNNDDINDDFTSKFAAQQAAAQAATFSDPAAAKAARIAAMKAELEALR